MYYFTVRQPPMYHQMTLEEFLFGTDVNVLITNNDTNTKTYERNYFTDRILSLVDVDKLVDKLVMFNYHTKELHEVERHTLYKTFKIPKKSGGLRTINAPEPALMSALRNLRTIFEVDFGALYHTSAFAYVGGRSIITCLKRHQANESKWYSKFDLHDFFGSTTKEFVTKMFGMIFPFSEVLKTERGAEEFSKAIDLCFLDGGLPQGTPISPTITNIMMIPIDFELSKAFRDFNNQRYIYTRYADDFQVSSRFSFRFKDVEAKIVEVLKKFDAPFQLNTRKTRYGSSSGRNWNLGLMINSNNDITVGYKAKKRFQAMLYNFMRDKLAGVRWDKSDVLSLDGYRNYYHMVEGETIDRIIAAFNSKHGVDIVKMIKEELQCV